MKDSFEERYLDVLQNTEFAIVRISQEYPETLDMDVENALESLVHSYKAEAGNRSVQSPRLSELEQQIYNSVKAMCEWRMGRAKVATKDGQPAELPMMPKTTEEIIACLKRIQRSVRRWSKRGGRRGYLDFVKQFIV